MLTITAQEIAKFTASAGLNLNHFKFTKSNIVVILQTLQERSATVKGQRGEEEGEESTEWECIKEHLMITVYTNWTAHVRTGEQKHSTWRNADVIIYTTEITFYIYVVCASDKTFNCNVALHLLSAKNVHFHCDLVWNISTPAISVCHTKICRWAVVQLSAISWNLMFLNSVRAFGKKTKTNLLHAIDPHISYYTQNTMKDLPHFPP